MTPTPSEATPFCVCGEPGTRGTLHRTDGPCYRLLDEPPRASSPDRHDEMREHARYPISRGEELAADVLELLDERDRLSEATSTYCVHRNYQGAFDCSRIAPCDLHGDARTHDAPRTASKRKRTTASVAAELEGLAPDEYQDILDERNEYQERTAAAIRWAEQERQRAEQAEAVNADLRATAREAINVAMAREEMYRQPHTQHHENIHAAKITTAFAALRALISDPADTEGTTP